MEKIYYSRTSRRFSDIMRRVRENYELHGIRPNWIGIEVFGELLTYWGSPEFKAKSETFKKMRASEKGDVSILLEVLVLRSMFGGW
jgi:hypothetical protein